MVDPRKYGYKRLETDEEFRTRILAKWKHAGTFVTDVKLAAGERLDELGWEIYLQRRIIDVY